MKARATIADVAELAGVHKATVSRALNKVTEHQVNAATAKRVQRAAEQLGYRPNMVARGLRTSLSMTVGVILPDLTNPLFPPIVRGIESRLAPRGYTALIVNTDGDDQLETAAVESLLERRVDGFIIATGQADHALLDGANRRDVKAVMLNRAALGRAFPLVTGDDAAGIAAAVDHLVELGHRHIVHMAGPANFTTSIVRADAFRAAVARHDGVQHSITPAPALSIRAGEAGMSELLRSHEELPTAIVAGNDLLAVGILRALRASGLSCPTDISVVGFNDMPFAEDLNPPLTTVRVPHTEMGTEAARLLLDSIDSDVVHPITVTLPVSLVQRASTARPREHRLPPR